MDNRTMDDRQALNTELRRMVATMKRQLTTMRELRLRVAHVEPPPPKPHSLSPAHDTALEQDFSMADDQGTLNLPDAPHIFATFNLDQLRAEAMGCTRCDLCKTRTNVAFGEGDPNAELMFIGEAPGHDEDVQGRPFVGRAGQLLNKIIEAMKLKREEVYIANVLKCRPPENRNPLPDEMDTCKPFLERQLQIIQPKVVVALGTFGAQFVLDTKERITRLRGRLIEKDGYKVMATYHPAFLLRNPNAKRDVWEDMKIVMQELGIPTDTVPPDAE